jgi:hypothetical protein
MLLCVIDLLCIVCVLKKEIAKGIGPKKVLNENIKGYSYSPTYSPTYM